ncbi:autotransporter outer membrane beta-barrel domain-containing protein [Salmonella enterica subsp. diarizonae serovar 16:z10:e,n,x,z15]|uniref:autotransporter outer membrane beta-barrel domain-containing protein n=1 Tax=Salmonella enterica TaxID=28901 RepID=UPI001F113F82|nr:autotransporter outer membrane beta-barrel domain-containing protein [Salmonella enterica subsp. diarizonae serovar 16:z10:e,n,x,z15]MCH5506898.1 autotransporter outer membrane beta-barrel domain-containing protein [Salmonella enterica subsp. diarizonae serovar 16:z10:e,n,x,z15]
MAVENKFKLNIIAASVLMGLSLSVVASAQAAGSVSAAETTPVKPEVKTLAGLTAPLSDEDYSKINVGGDTLADVLNETKNGSVAELKGKYQEAQKAYSKLSETQKGIISKLNTTTADKEAATQKWNDFGNQLKAADDVYTSNLNSLYNANHNAFTIGVGGVIAPDTNKGSTYDKFLTAYQDLAGESGKVKKLNDAIIALLNSPSHGENSKDNLAREAKIVAYSNYLQKYADLQTAKLQADSVRNIVIQNIADILNKADSSANKEEVSGALGNVKTNFDTWNKSKNAANEKTLAESVKTLVSIGGVDFTQTEKDAATAWSTAADDVSTKESGLADAGKATEMNKAIQSVPVLTDQNILRSEDEPKDFNDALNKLKAAYTALLKDGAFQDDVDPVKGSVLPGLIADVQGAQSTLGGLKTEYQAKVKNIKEAGAARLNLLLNELPGLQKGFSEAQNNYQNALKEYDADNNDAKAAKGALEGLYGANGTSGALHDYLDSLKKTSEGIGSALTSAASTYSGAVTASGATQEDKNEALYKLISTQKTLVPVKLQMDTEHLNLLQTAPADAINGLTALKNDLSTAAANKAKAKADYIGAVEGYLAADKAYQTSKSETNAATLAQAKAHLMTVVGTDDISKLYKVGDKLESGFKQFDELTADNSSVIHEYDDAVKALAKTDGSTEIQKARAEVVKSMKTIAGLMPLSSTEEQNSFRTAYNNALKEVSVKSTTADEQSKAKDAGKVTHILGSLSGEEIAKFDVNSGNYKSIIVNVDKEGNITGVKDNFTGEDLYTGSKDKPFTTTVLDIRALELGNGDKLSDTNTITVGEAGTKDKKATPVEVWAKTAGAKWDKDANGGQGAYDKSGNGPAVKLSGELRTATAALDENGKPVDGQIVRGADQIHLQNVNIHNSFTLDDKVKMLADDVAALNQQAADKLKLGQPAKSDDVNHIEGVNDWLRKQNDLLNGKYDNLQLTGLQIDTKTVNPGFNLTDNDDKHIGEFVNTTATVAPTDANILLDNLNITLQNDSVNGTSTAIDLSGTGNHILAKGGVFDAGKADNLKQANVLDITGEHNLIEFNGSVLKGDIRSDNAKKPGTQMDNTVNLTDGSLTGNAIAGTGNLRLNLDHSVWTGGAGPNSPDISLSNNSVWNVKDFGSDHSADVKNGQASVSSLSLYGSNSINLVDAGGLAQLGGHGFAGEKSAVTLKVDHDLTSDGKGVTSVLAGTYSPDNLHSLTNTGRADGYQFGTLKVDGLATGGKYALSVESAGAEPYTVGGRLADGPGATSAHEFVSYKTAESRPDDTNSSVLKSKPSTADFTSLSAPAELGVYQYAAEKVMDGVNNRTNIYYSSTGKLSNSAATVVSLAAAPVDVANLESDTLAKHMNSVRHGKDSGVWVSYFGGENRNTTAAGPEYTLKTNGVMLGADTLTENDWLAGVAVSSARSDMSVMNSSGDLNSYGAQFYMSRRYDSGVFVDSALQFNHFSNTAKARMINGQQAKADFSGNSYGLEAKVGYAWNSEGFFAEPYVRAAARAFDGEHYALSNGMTVNSNDYKSMLGEVGTDLGYQYAISGGYVKPYLHLAALNEFADGNSVRVNNVSLDNSVKGAAFQAGLGAEVKVTDNLGGYAAFDYTKGDNTERPWQATVGVNYTW